jgi:hypothetical protein
MYEEQARPASVPTGWAGQIDLHFFLFLVYCLLRRRDRSMGPHRSVTSSSDITSSHRRLGVASFEAFARFLLMYRKYSPDQPRDERGRWTEADDGPSTTGSTGIIRNDERTKDPEIDRITDILIDKLADAIEKLDDGSGALYGTRIHHAFAESVRAANLPGISVETSFADGIETFYGMLGSNRTDVILRAGSDGAGEVLAIWDVKTGAATLSPSRLRSLRSAVGVDESVPIIELNAITGIKIKSQELHSQRTPMVVSSLVMLCNRRLSTAELQHAVDVQNYLVRLALVIEDPAQGVWKASLDGRPVTFTLRQGPPATFGVEPHHSLLGTHAVVVPTAGNTTSVTAGLMVMLAYAEAVHGLFRDDQDNRARKDGRLKRMVEEMSAAELNRMADFFARYPDMAAAQPKGPRTIVVSRAQ